MDGRGRQAGADGKIAEPISLIVFGKGFDNEKGAVYRLHAAIPRIGVVVGVGFRLDQPAPDHVFLHRDLHSSCGVKACSLLDFKNSALPYDPPARCRSGSSEAACRSSLTTGPRRAPFCTWPPTPRPAILSSRPRPGCRSGRDTRRPL